MLPVLLYLNVVWPLIGRHFVTFHFINGLVLSLFHNLDWGFKQHSGAYGVRLCRIIINGVPCWENIWMIFALFLVLLLLNFLAWLCVKLLLSLIIVIVLSLFLIYQWVNCLAMHWHLWLLSFSNPLFGFRNISTSRLVARWWTFLLLSIQIRWLQAVLCFLLLRLAIKHVDGICLHFRTILADLLHRYVPSFESCWSTSVLHCRLNELTTFNVLTWLSF